MDRILVGMNARRRFRDLPLVGAAFGGVVLGHWLSYLVAFPNTRIRGEVLIATGHGYWMTAVKLAVVLAVVTLAAVAIRQVQETFGRETPSDQGPWSLAVRLAGLQVLGYVALELTERLAAGAPPSSLLAHQVLGVGILIQVLLAASLALLLSLFTRAVRAVARALTAARFPKPVRRVLSRSAVLVLRPALVAGSAGPRGPPLQ